MVLSEERANDEAVLIAARRAQDRLMARSDEGANADRANDERSRER